MRKNNRPGFRIGEERHRRFRKDDLDKVPRRNNEANPVEDLVGLTAKSDPVLAEIWDNEKDSAYDRL
jgi:hypothetical protein